MRKIIIFVCIIMPLFQGCAIGVLAAGVGYAIGAGRQGTAKIAEAKAKYTEHFNVYKLGMENINLEREKAGLEPQPIMTFKEWIEQQPLTPEEQHIFREFKRQTPNEVGSRVNEQESTASE